MNGVNLPPPTLCVPALADGGRKVEIEIFQGKLREKGYFIQCL